MKVYEGKDGAYVTFEKTGVLWTVVLRNSRGDVADKVRCDDYQIAVEYRSAFIKTARLDHARQPFQLHHTARHRKPGAPYWAECSELMDIMCGHSWPPKPMPHIWPSKPDSLITPPLRSYGKRDRLCPARSFPHLVRYPIGLSDHRQLEEPDRCFTKSP